MISGGGAAVFDALDNSTSALGQSWSLAKNAAYYKVKDELGLVEWLYWLCTNKYEYTKMITFFNT
jgi:hypothetical protein